MRHFLKPLLTKSRKFTTSPLAADMGYTIDNHISISAAMSKGPWYYGLCGQLNISTGEKGRSYDKIINWDNDLDGISDAGGYYSGSFGVDLGYYFLENLCLGGGVGYVLTSYTEIFTIIQGFFPKADGIMLAKMTEEE